MLSTERRRRRPRTGGHVRVFLDNNALDRTDEPRSVLVDRFLELWNAGLEVIKPHGVVREAQHPNTPPEVANLMVSGIFTVPTGLNSDEVRLRRAIATVLQGNANPGRHAADADHLAEASKYGASHFITHDRRILGMAAALRVLCHQVQIATLEQFMTDHGQPLDSEE